MNRRRGDLPHRGRERRHDNAGFFVVGGPVQAERGCYLPRAADDELYRLIREGNDAHVFAPPQTGKTSLGGRLAERLRAEGRHVALIDLAQLSSKDRADDAGRWFYSIAFRLVRQLRLRADLQAWWQDKTMLGNAQRLTELYSEVVLENTSEPVTIVVDTVEHADTVPFADQFLASIRTAHNMRAAEPRFARLTFVMLGVRAPTAMPERPELSPLAVSQRVALGDFAPHELARLAPALGAPREAAQRAIERIHYWTGGQPLLTQKLARALAREAEREHLVPLVDLLARRHFLNRGAYRNDPHLSLITRELLGSEHDIHEVLATYGRVRKGSEVLFDPDSPVQRHLLTCGLLVQSADGSLALRNRVYAEVFTARWVNEHLPVRWRSAAKALAATLLIVFLPLWYTQMLPAGWIRDFGDRAIPLETLAETHRRMRAFPGHRGTADRLMLRALETRSEAATSLETLLPLTATMAELPGGDARAAETTAAFWDRRAAGAELRHLRDAALLARLRALAVPTVERRRRAAALVGDDLPLLTRSLAVPGGFDQAAISADGERLIFAQGATITTWDLSRRALAPPVAWQPSALRPLRLVERVTLERGAPAGPVTLTLSVAHDRVEDLTATVTAPSGRGVSLPAAEAERLADGRLRFGPGSALGAFRAEPRRGTWTLSVADGVVGVSGELLDWRLAFSGREVEAETAPPRPLADPEPVPAERIVLAPLGRYVVALPAEGGGVAQIWEPGPAAPVTAVPIDAADRLIGFVLDDRVLLVADGEGLAAWSLATGERLEAPPVSGSPRLAALAAGGGVLAVATADPDAGVEVVDLIERRRIGAVARGVEHRAIAVADMGQWVAVADPDRAVRLWRPGVERPRAELDFAAMPTGLAFDPGGSELAITLGERGMVLWPVGAPATAARPLRGQGPWRIDFDPTQTGMMIGAAGAGFQILGAGGLATELPLLRLGLPPQGRVWGALRKSRALAVTASPAAGVARVWRLPFRVAAPRESDELMTRAMLAPGGELIALANLAGEVQLLPADAGPEELDAIEDAVGFVGHTGAPTAFAFDALGTVLASGGNDGKVRVWNTETGVPLSYIARHGASPVTQVAVDPAGRRVASTDGRVLKLWRAADGELLAMHTPPARPSVLAFAAGEGALLVGDATGGLHSLDRNGWRTLATLPARVTAIGVAGTGRPRIAAADSAGTLQISFADEASAGISTTLAAPAEELLFSADGRYLVARAGQWLHRFGIAGSDLEPAGNRLLPAARVHPGLVPADETASRVALLAGDPLPSLETLAMNAADVAPLAGSSEDLLRYWRVRLLAETGKD